MIPENGMHRTFEAKKPPKLYYGGIVMSDCRSLTAMFRALHDESSLETTLTAHRTEMASSEMPRSEEDMNSLGGS